MFNFLKSIFSRVHIAQGIEVRLLPDENMTIYSVVLSERRGKIIKTHEAQIAKETLTIENKKKSNLPVSLVITGKGVLIKQVLINEIPPNPIEAVLPTSNPDDFFNEIHTLGKYAMIVLIRKSKLQEIVKRLSKSYKILSVSIGGFEDLNNVLLNLNCSDESIETSTYQFKYDYASQSIHDIYQSSKTVSVPTMEYNIGDQYVKSDCLISFAAAQALLADSLLNSQKFPSPGLAKEREDFMYQIFFKLSIMFFLTTITLLLLINFLFNKYLTEQNINQRRYALTSQSNQEMLDKRKKSFEAKNNILVEHGWEHQSRISFFADRIASVVPSDIVFTEMNIFPIHYNAGFAGNGFLIQKDTIDITATCADPALIREFSDGLIKTKGIKKVTVKDYKYKKELGTGIFLMQIEIQ